MPAKIQAARATRPGWHRRPLQAPTASGTAQSSGAGVNTGSGVTTGSGRSAGSGTDITGPQRSGDAAINEENKEVDRKIKSICRGC